MDCDQGCEQRRADCSHPTASPSASPAPRPSDAHNCFPLQHPARKVLHLVIEPAVTHRFLSGLFSEDVHAKRISSLANATLGVVSSASLAVNTIGQGLALARGRLPKH